KYIISDEKQLNYNSGEFVDLVVGLINSLDSSDHKVTDWDSYITGNYTPGTVTYPTSPDGTEQYSSTQVRTLVNVISNIAMSAIDAFFDVSKVGLADDNIYSSQFVVTIAKTVYPLFDSAAVQSVLDILGVDRVNLDSLAQELKDAGYDRTAELVLADITDSDLIIQIDDTKSVKVNWTTAEKKNADGEVLDVNGKVVTDRKTQTPDTVDVNKFWSVDKDGKYLYVDGTASFEVIDGKDHVMSYWITSEDEEGNTVYEKYTADDEKENPAHVEGTYKVRDKQFADINWDIAADNAFFKIYGDNKDLSMNNAVAYRESLVDALGTLLYPLVDVFDFLFNSGELNIYGLTHLVGVDGYQNAIYPLLQVLGCDAERNGLKTPEQYKAEANKKLPNDERDTRKLITNILNPLFSRMNNILLGSEGNKGSFGFGKVILNTLPNLAIFIENGGLQKFIGELIYPIGNIIDTALKILPVGDKSTSLFDVAFDTFVSADTLEPLHTKNGFEDTGLTERIIEKLVVAVFNPTDKAADEDGNEPIQWSNAHKNIYEIVAGFLTEKEVEDGEDPKLYLSVNENGELEVHNIILSRKEKNDDGTEVTKKYPLPTVKIPSLNNELIGKLAKLGAPIPWTEDGYNKNDGNGPIATSRRTDAFVTVWTFIWSIVENNYVHDLEGAKDTSDVFLNQLLDGFLKDTLGTDLYTTASPYIKTALSRSSSRVLAAFILATQDLATKDIDYGDDWDDYFAKLNDLARPTYPVKNLAADLPDSDVHERYEDTNVTVVLHTLSGIAQSALSAITDKSLSELSVDLIFTDEIVATISQAICSLASNETLKSFLPLVDIDLSLDNIIKKLEAFGYDELADKVAEYNVPGKDIADIKWFVQATNEKGELLWNDDEKTKPKMVPSDIAHLWYVEDADGFVANVWNNVESKVDIPLSDVNAQYRFARALTAALAPFSDIVNTLFNAGTSELLVNLMSMIM
ncbi:MAG: hypothetical protein K2F65_04090, partial [Eubacterium sp.]|nr:hypothetical protein [Eubacterium sp.]